MGVRLLAQDVTVRRNDRSLLDGLSIEAAPGQVLVLLGPSGGGKTSLLRVLHGLLRPDAGRVVMQTDDGTRHAVVDPDHAAASWVRQVALVQQRPGLLSTTTIEDVAFALRARGAARTEASERAARWLERFDLAALADAPTRRLSGGEAQRVALARALALQTSVLLLDECTNQLDPAHTAQVERLVRARADEGATIVLVTHSVHQARRLADRFVHLAKGRVVERGPGHRLQDPATEATRIFLQHA